MSYFRKIIYLYEYTDVGSRGRNVGFAKLSKRKEKLKIDISLSEKRMLSSEKIYLLDKDKSAVNKVFFGTITEDKTDITMSKVMSGAGMLKGELAGVIIGGESYVICAGTEDESIRVMDYVKSEREKKTERVWENLTAAETEEIERAGQEMPQQKAQDIEPVEERPAERKTAEEKPEEGRPADKGPIVETPAEKKQEEEQPEEEEMVEVELEEEHDVAFMFRKLFANHPNMYPFEDDEMEMCVQISPRDFSDFPKAYWHMGSNTFLLQGYYNYRHLILARIGNRIYVGIPGQFHRRDKYLADMFGFGRFKGIQKKAERLGDFGYWLNEIELPPSSSLDGMVCVHKEME